ncbi:MAG: hypothetical protein GY868_06065, partial [Deltaproteobacteria bacterium]|nr:hypothetical protein [Deltaproteobacteria bacterium]
ELRISAVTSWRQTMLRRPVSREKRCIWLVLKSEAENNFSIKKSRILVQGLHDNHTGVVLNTDKLPLVLGRTLLVPLCIDAWATRGQWFVTIETEVDGEELFQETIQASFMLE